MSFSLTGKIIDIGLIPIAKQKKPSIPFYVNSVRLIPDQDFSIQDDDCKKCVFKDDFDAKLLPYKTCVELTFENAVAFDCLLSVGMRAHFVFDSNKGAEVNVKSDMSVSKSKTKASKNESNSSQSCTTAPEWNEKSLGKLSEIHLLQ